MGEKMRLLKSWRIPAEPHDIIVNESVQKDIVILTIHGADPVNRIMSREAFKEMGKLAEYRSYGDYISWDGIPDPEESGDD